MKILKKAWLLLAATLVIQASAPAQTADDGSEVIGQ